MDDDYGEDADFLAALEASAAASSHQAIHQPTPQRLDRAPPTTTTTAGPKIVQPAPQALPSRSSGSSILVSPRQKGNPVIACLKSMPWEYSDIPADYGLGLTTCALFLSLKYHRLHPEYIYTRIRNLQGKYNLRILLTMVDISNHEDSLRELSKTSLVNNVTVILCWSAAEAARYLELYKSYEHANFAAIRGQQATSYAEKLVELVTVPRGINKADAVALVSTFGSLKHAINADPEQVSIVGGWGEKKVKSWCKAVEQPFRIKKAAKRGVRNPGSDTTISSSARLRTAVLEDAIPIGKARVTDVTGTKTSRSTGDATLLQGAESDSQDDNEIAASSKEPKQRSRVSASNQEEQLSGGIAAALAKLRQGG
ncbi:DNA repair protein rad10 [Podospora appendiculata]|uniref:DNA repair protein rad10 n=1 Tax=Podospora appendiculata TaxID=314037 RepID=A0AAE0XG48_9PEZI|nr:DNA repair protein rad10 [Podospora appendiculata]